VKFIYIGKYDVYYTGNSIITHLLLQYTKIKMY